MKLYEDYSQSLDGWNIISALRLSPDREQEVVVGNPGM
jgi:hypothetical protein